jgi:hypothetical protein
MQYLLKTNFLKLIQEINISIDAIKPKIKAYIEALKNKKPRIIVKISPAFWNGAITLIFSFVNAYCTRIV